MDAAQREVCEENDAGVAVQQTRQATTWQGFFSQYIQHSRPTALMSSYPMACIRTRAAGIICSLRAATSNNEHALIAQEGAL
jgi:hypothetical protein